MSVKSKWHNLAAQKVLENLHSHVDGLTESESKKRLENTGLMRLEKKNRDLRFLYL